MRKKLTANDKTDKINRTARATEGRPSLLPCMTRMTSRAMHRHISWGYSRPGRDAIHQCQCERASREMALGIDPASALARPLILGSRLFRLARPEIERVGRDTMALFGAVRHNAFFGRSKVHLANRLSLLLRLANGIFSLDAVTNGGSSCWLIWPIGSLLAVLYKPIASFHYLQCSICVRYSLHLSEIYLIFYTVQ